MADYLSQTKIWRWGIIFDSNYCCPAKRKYTNKRKHQTLPLMGATRLASEKDAAFI